MHIFFQKQLRRSKFIKGLAAAAAGLQTDILKYRLIRQRNRAISSYFSIPGVKCLHLGCGTNLLSGWLNADLSPSTPEVLYLDAASRLPFDDHVFNCVFSEHLIEHLSRRDGSNLLRECRRILKPAGVIRISTPDFEKIISLMMPPATKEKDHYISAAGKRYFPSETQVTAGMIVNNFLYDFGHLFNYTAADLVLSLEMAGFDNINHCTSRNSRIPELEGVEGHADRVGDVINAFETMIFEATNPIT